MKNILLILVAVGLYGAAFAQKSFVSFEARIENRNRDTVYITAYNRVDNIIKTFPINEEGYFKDTLRVSEGLYTFYDKVEVTSLYLKNGFDLNMGLNAKQFDETVKYTGAGSSENNFLAAYMMKKQKYDAEEFLAKSEQDFDNLLNERKKESQQSLKSGEFDSAFVSVMEKAFTIDLTFVEAIFKKKQIMSKLNNTISPSFDYENYNGGTTKLEDLKGKYLYIDIWATWCAPCIAEMPFLKKLEEEFKNKNITFVSISVDVKKNHEKWKHFVTDRAPAGIQLFADNDWSSSFIKHYSINSIPRFILIDPQGKIINADAERPSSRKLREALDNLLN